MTSAFVIGCGVAGAAYALKGVLHVGSKVAQNPEAMKQATALGAGLKGAGSVFRMPSFMSFTKHAGGFDAAMNRREAALILNCRESATKDELKKAHRKMMLVNHPDRGGSPLIATKINEAHECLSGQGRSSTSAFS